MSQKRAILVTGGAGYIGAHCCKAVSEAGYLPVCFDNLSTGHRSFVKWGPLVEGDVSDTRRVADAMAAHEIVAVMHFSAFNQIRESGNDPQKYYFKKSGGALSPLNPILGRGCNKLVIPNTRARHVNSGPAP